MKKKLAILVTAMAAMLCLFLAGCGGSNGDADLSDSQFVGTWQAVSASLGDTTEPFDATCILTLNGDGSGTLDDGEETVEFTWQLTDEGFKTMGDDAKMKFVDNGDGTISAKILGTRLNFEKQ